VHPPARGHYFLGTQPLVHAGFLRSWHAGGLNTQVLTLLKEIIAGTASGNSFAEAAAYEASGSMLGGQSKRHREGFWRIICTGHSLGGEALLRL
jgi:hypothetical protein